MANGGGDGPIDVNWWQALLGGIGTALTGLAIGLKRRRRSDEDTDILDEKTSLRLIEIARAEHLATRVEVRQVLDAVRLEFEELLESVRDEHEKQMTLTREESQKVRASVFSSVTELAKQVNAMHRDMIDRTRGGS